MKNQTLRLAALATIAASAFLPAQAGYWYGTNNSNFSDSGNWNAAPSSTSWLSVQDGIVNWTMYLDTDFTHSHQFYVNSGETSTESTFVLDGASDKTFDGTSNTTLYWGQQNYYSDLKIAGAAWKFKSVMAGANDKHANSSHLELAGGTLGVVNGFTIYKTATIAFNGGTLQALGDKEAFLPDSDYLAASVMSGGAVIDTDYAVSFAKALVTGVESTDGGLVKNGTGRLTITGTDTYTGATVINAGELALADGGAAFMAGTALTGGITLAGGKLVLAEPSGAAEGDCFSVANVTLGSGITFSSDYVSVEGNSGLTWQVAYENSALYFTATDETGNINIDSVKTYPVGQRIVGTLVIGVGGYLYFDASSLTTYGDSGTVLFDATDVTMADGETEAEHIIVKAPTVSNSVLRGAVAVADGTATIAATSGGVVTAWTAGGASYGWYGVDGNWSMGVPGANDTALFYTDSMSQTGDTWRQANTIIIAKDATWTFRTDKDKYLYFTTMKGEGTFKIGDAAKIQTQNEGHGTIGVATLDVSNGDATCSLDGRNGSWTVNSPITGTGNLTLVKNVYLKGDNSGFTGAVTKNDNTIRFDAAKAGFSSASSVAITGTLWLWFNEGTITFGGDTTMTASGNCGINVPSTVSDITLVFGNNNGNVEMTKSGSNPYSVYVQNGNSWTQGSDKVTIKKTGAGTMTNLVANTYNFVAAGGTTYFATDSAAAITVEDGAAIGGNARVNSVTFEDGAAFEVFTTTADETTTVDNLTATTVTVEGALVVKMSEETAEEAGSGSNTTTVLTATTLNGDFAKQAVVNDAGAPVAVYGSGTDYWYAQKDGNTIQIYTRNPSNGFMILISSSESKEDVSDSALNSWLTGQGYALSTGAGCIAAETALNSENTHGMTGFEAYLLGYDNIEDAAPVMGATVSGENISLSFAGTTPRTIDGVTVTYAVQSTNSIESDWTEKASGTSSPVTLAFDNALLYNRLVATVGLSE